MTEGVYSVPEQQPAAPHRSFVQRLTGVLFSPDETFADIVAKPNVLAPLMLMLVISIVSAVLLVPRMDFDTMIRDQLERSGKAATMSAGDLDRAARMGSSFAKLIGYTSPVLSIVIWVLMAGVLLITFRLFGGQGNFAQAFAVTLYAWMPLLVKGILGVIIAMTKSTLNPEEMATLVASNPAVLVDLHTHQVLFSLLSSIDLFTIWSIVLLIIGFAHVARTSKARSAAVILIWWGVVVFFKVGFAALGAMKAAKAGA